LAEAIGKKLTTKKEELGKFLQRYGSILSLASFSVAGGLAEVSPGAAAMGVGDTLSSVGLDDLKARVSKVLVESGKRVVVLIDDIDRLDRAEIHAILKLIKLSASFANTAYVLAFDDEVVAASLGERYGAGGIEAGRQFLEKIIQVPLHLPDAESIDLRTICFEGVDGVLSQNGIKLPDDDAEAFVRHFSDGIMPALRTPRQAKRYINAITFAVPLLKEEVHVVDQLLIEALRSTYPRLYLKIRDNPDVFTGERVLAAMGDGAKQKDEAKGVVESGLTDLTSGEREGAIDLLKALFPRLNAIFSGSTYGRDWNKTWDAQRRITSADYFRRYFQYSVPARDIPDGMVTSLLAAAKAGNAIEIDAFFEGVSNRNAWSRALDKLFARTPDLDGAGRKALALVLAKRSAHIPKERGMFSSIMSSANRSAYLVVTLVEGLKGKGERLALALKVMAEATSLPFAAECLRFLSPGGREPGDSAGLDEKQTKQAGAALAGRIAKDLTDNSDYAHYGRTLGGLMWLWKTYGPAGEMTGYLTKRFTDHPDEAVKFLDAFIGRAYGLESGLSHKTTFDRQDFDNVALLVPPDVVLGALKESYGLLLDSVTFEKCYELQGDEQTACRFAAIFGKVQEEKKANASQTAKSTGPSNKEN
jgi:hypothetical protein